MRIYLFAAMAALAVSLAPAGEAVAAPAEPQAYNRGNALYAEGKYDEALAAYGAVTIESPDVEYNRGAAYYKKGTWGGPRSISTGRCACGPATPTRWPTSRI